MKETLLRLLLLHNGLETAEEWASIMEEKGEKKTDVDVDETVMKEKQKRSWPMLIIAIDDIVPYLADYSTLSGKLKALMQYIETEYSIQVNRLVQGWLQLVHSSLCFRRWLLCDWLQCSHLTSVELMALLQWRHALLVATTNETAKSLRWKLLGFLSAVNETIAAHSACEKMITAAPTALESLETVEKLLDFCFLYAEELASYSFLCAAKIHALAVKTQRSAIIMSQDEELLVRLRWSVMMKPMLFTPLLQHTIALESAAEPITASHLWTSVTLSNLVRLVDVTSRQRLLMEMAAARDNLERAFLCNAEHIHCATSESTSVSSLEAAVAKYVKTLSDNEKQVLVAELERDLDEAPPYLFPYVFIFLSLLLSATLVSSVPEVQKLVTKALTILFTLFERRTHDVTSTLDVLNLMLHLSLAHNPFWLKTNSQLYLQTIESLSEIITIEVEPKIKWAANIALHQLIFECDQTLVQSHCDALVQLLPARTKRLVFKN